MTIEQLIENLRLFPKDLNIKGKIFYKIEGDFIIQNPVYSFDLKGRTSFKTVPIEETVEIWEWENIWDDKDE